MKLLDILGSNKKDDSVIIGDPYKFAILIDLVKDWNITGEKNGLILFLLKGAIYPPEISTGILNSDLYYFFKNEISYEGGALFFEMEKEIAIERLFKLEENDKFKISTPTMEDNNYYFYVVFGQEQARIIGAKIEPDTLGEYNFQNIIESHMPIDCFEDIINKLEVFYRSQIC